MKLTLEALCAYLESREGLMGVCRLDALMLHYNLVWRKLAINIRPGSQFLRGNLASAPPAVQNLRMPM